MNTYDYIVPFISVEGLDGAGKSNAIRIIKEELEKAGFKCRVTREPGGTPLAETIRGLLKFHTIETNEDVFVNTETNLFYAARIQNTEGVIKPNLENGIAQIADRYSDSTKAYQHARGQSMESIEAVHKASIGDFAPNLTIYLDVNLITSKARMKKRAETSDIFENEADLFFNKARQVYLDIAKKESKRFKVVNAMDGIEEVSENVRKVVSDFIIEFKLSMKNKKKEYSQLKLK